MRCVSAHGWPAAPKIRICFEMSGGATGGWPAAPKIRICFEMSGGATGAMSGLTD